MANPLRESTNAANQLTMAQMPYEARAADFATPAIEAMHNEARHEAEMQNIALRTQMYSSELDLRQKQAATRAQEAQAEVLLRESQMRLAGMQEDRAKMDILKDFAELPPFPLGGDRYRVGDIGPGGSRSFTEVGPNDPRVARWLQQQQDEHALNQARIRNYETGHQGVRYEPTYKDLVERESKLSNEVNAAKRISDPGTYGYRTPEQIASMEDELRGVQFKLRSMTPSNGAGAATSAPSEPSWFMPKMRDAARQMSQAAPSEQGPPVADYSKTPLVDQLRMGWRNDLASQFSLDPKKVDAALQRLVRLTRASGRDADLISGGPASDATIEKWLIDQIEQSGDDPDGQALTRMLMDFAK